MAESTILLGAVAYDPKVVTIWEGMRAHFQAAGVPLDFALYSNYERQVDELLAGHIDIAWNTPLAHVRVKRRTSGTAPALGMRDADRDFHSKIVVRKQAGIRALTDLAMKACGGAAFSNHLPVERLFRDARAGWVMAPTADHLQDFVGRALTGMPLL